MSNVVFDKKQFNRLFPFYFILDESLCISSFGDSLGKIIPIYVGAKFSDFFTIQRPEIDQLSTTHLHALHNNLVIIEVKKNEPVILRGQFEFFSSNNTFLFMGSPWFDSMEKIKKADLKLNDFALHDAVIDLLHVLKIQEIATAEVKELLAALQKKNDEQKILEQIQVTSANQLSSLVMNLQLGVLLENGERKISVVNQKFCDLFSIPVPVEMLIGTDCTTAAEQSKNMFKQPQAFVDRITKLLDDQQLVIGDRLELSDGRFFERDFIPIWNNSEYLGHMWVYKDITEEEKFKLALEKQKIFYEGILNKIPADIVVFDKEHRYLFVNPVAIKNPEIRRWIIGKTDNEYLEYRNKPLSIAKARNEIFTKALESGELSSFEEELLKPDGSKDYIIRNFYPVINDDGQAELIIGYGVNITLRKNIELQLQLNEKKYRDVVNFSLALIITHDIHGVIQTVNPSVCRALELTEEEIIGNNIHDYLIEPYKSGFAEQYLTKILEDGEAGGEFAILSKSGKIIHLLYHNFLLHEPGSESYIIGFSQDITARVVAEEELVVAKQQIEHALVAKDRVLADMSHEIRTPMNGIMGIARLLEKTKLDDPQREKLRMITESADNLLVIVNDVLDLEKIVAGKLDLESIDFNLVEKIKTIVESFFYKTEEKNLTLNLHNSIDPSINVKGDPYRLSQVLNNLLGNAIKFTDVGSVDVYSKICKDENEKVIVEVKIKDTGIGISADKIGQVFSPYLQGRADTARKYGGTGLGLSISKKLVEMQHGTINAESKNGVGSVFTFTLPYEKVYPVDVEKKVSTDASFLQGMKILVAEDNEINQFLIKHILENWNCAFKIVPNGEMVVAELQQNEYDIILMDILMPIMTGVEATAMIRKFKEPSKANIPIIALTANALKGDDLKYLSAGMDDYLAKPFDEEKLITVIKRTLYEEVVQAKPEITNGRLYDLAHLKAIAPDNDKVLYKFLSLFLTTTPGILDQMKLAMAENDLKKVSELAHHIKPALQSFGVESLYTIVEELNKGFRLKMGKKLFREKVKKMDTTLRICLEQLKEDFSL